MRINYFLLWLPMIAIALANATFRELVIVNFYQVQTAHQLSTVSLIILCTIYIWSIFPYLKVNSTRQSLFIGLVWVLLTILFEFTLGIFTSQSWESMLDAYNLLSGNIWTVFLVFLFLTPYILFTIKKYNEKIKANLLQKDQIRKA